MFFYVIYGLRFRNRSLPIQCPYASGLFTPWSFYSYLYERLRYNLLLCLDHDLEY
ncbi:unnamed protein product [Brassica rapa subsp. trilocularis]